MTIAGTHVTNMQSGFLANRKPTMTYVTRPYVWRYHNADHSAFHNMVLRCHCTQSYTDLHATPGANRDYQESSLNDRGWILQEFLLSPRLLLFSQLEMRFECEGCGYFESRGNKEFTNVAAALKHQLLPYKESNDRDHNHTIAWYRIINESSSIRNETLRNQVTSFQQLRGLLVGCSEMSQPMATMSLDS